MGALFFFYLCTKVRGCMYRSAAAYHVKVTDPDTGRVFHVDGNHLYIDRDEDTGAIVNVYVYDEKDKEFILKGGASVQEEQAPEPPILKGFVKFLK
jgi:hypothetical protein